MLQAPLSRRRFLAGLSSIAGAAALPSLIPQTAMGANTRIRLGMIGAGRRTHQLMPEMCQVTNGSDNACVVAVSDIWPKKSTEWIAAYREKMPAGAIGEIATEIDYRKMLDRKDIDAVVVTTGDHWHALPAIHACQAGKDVYGEKPLSLTVVEGRAMVSAVRKYQRVFQTGAQQRSNQRNRQACELIHNGRLGKIREVNCMNYWSSIPASECQFKEEPVPEGMDWDRWCGQTELVPFSFGRYLTYENPGWQKIREYSGGFMTNWGAHALDMVQWALGTDDTGPIEFIPESRSPIAKVSFRYANGTVVHLTMADDSVMGGGHFVGEKGEMFMNRGKFNTEPIAISKEELGPEDTRLYVSNHHVQNWLDCIRSREKPISDVEVGHRSVTICHLCGIARRLGRPIQWDPAKETCPGDEEANALLDRPRRKPYELPAV